MCNRPVPGLIRIASARGSGTGVVLTPPGLALTSAQVAAGRGTVTARELPSGHACAARIVGIRRGPRPHAAATRMRGRVPAGRARELR